MKTVIVIFLSIFPLFCFGQETKNTNYLCSEKSLEINVPAANDGKFRFKTREKNQGFGKTFATRQKAFNENVYLEWQVGYDALIEDVKSGKKQTSLTQATFIGSNGNEKYLYEISEILYEAVKCGIISTKDLDKLQTEITAYNRFFDEKEILMETYSSILFNGMPFKETAIKLPTLFMPQSDGTQIEISIQKQQYASGVQPMIYFDIPFKSFANWKDLDGKKSVKGNKLKYIIKKENAEVIPNMLKIFGMASARHKFDVEQILKTLKKLI